MELVVLLGLVAMAKLRTPVVVEGVIMEVGEEAGQVVAEDHHTVMGQLVHRLRIPLLLRMAMAV